MSIFGSMKSNSVLNKERVEKVPGLSYYDNFISKDDEEYLLDYLSNIEYTNEFNRATKYYGYNYSHKKKFSEANEFIGNIPKTLNLIFNKLGIEYNQLVIEKLPANTQYSFPIHSKIFCNNIMTISIGGDCVAEFENKLLDESSEILIKRRSLIVISNECRKECSYKISNNKTHIFNDRKFKRSDRYTLTFKNIKFINKADDDETYYFSY